MKHGENLLDANVMITVGRRKYELGRVVFLGDIAAIVRMKDGTVWRVDRKHMAFVGDYDPAQEKDPREDGGVG